MPAAVSRVSTPSSVRPPARKRPPSASSKVDEDWVMETPKRSRTNRNHETKREELR